ncbi:MAG: serine--tRNA ligase [archaeon]
MLDIKQIRSDPDLVRANLKKRNDPSYMKMLDELIGFDVLWRKNQAGLDKERHERNRIALEISNLKKEKKDADALIRSMKSISSSIEKKEKDIADLRKKMDGILHRLPNLLHESVPVGLDDTQNVEVRRWGTLKKPSFKLKSHNELLESLDLADIERAAKVSGARFYYLKNDLVMLDFALMKFALDFLIGRGYTIMETPLMIRRKPMEGAVALSDFEDMLYKIEGEDLYMIATSEHALAGYHMDETLDPKSLPLKYAGLSACFRKEAGSHGKDTKGIFRVHQFNKIEQFIFSTPETSWEEHEKLIKNAEYLFQALELPYRLVNICTGDIGTVAAKKYDLEVWMPHQNAYREMVSCSNCTDYQSRKLNIRYGKEGTEKELVHTLNSTAIATSRAIVAILENNQQKDSTVSIPKVLWPYMNGKKVLGIPSKSKKE